MKSIKGFALVCCIAVLFAACAPAAGPADAADEPEIHSPEETEAAEQNQAPATASAIVEPEQLISKQEAEQLTGIALKDGKITEQQVVGQKICFYDAADDNADGFLQVSVTQQAAFPAGSTQSPTAIYEATKGAFADMLIEVEGIGDEAFIAVPGLHILADGYYILVCAGDTGDGNIQSIIKSGGALAVQNLDRAVNP